MVPGLFRSSHKAPAAQLLALETTFASRVADAFPDNARFRRPDLPALLQHYGFRTSWLDVVDNLWTAVWFATHSMSQADGRVLATCENRSGWLYFLAVSDDCTALDLRESHHALSLRPHAQAGWSMKGPEQSVAELDDFVIATVEFPVDERWRLKGYLSSEEFFFPPQRLDDTLKRLYSHDVDRIAADVEGEKNLTGALGRVFPSRPAGIDHS